MQTDQLEDGQESAEVADEGTAWGQSHCSQVLVVEIEVEPLFDWTCSWSAQHWHETEWKHCEAEPRHEVNYRLWKVGASQQEQRQCLIFADYHPNVWWRSHHQSQYYESDLIAAPTEEIVTMIIVFNHIWVLLWCIYFDVRVHLVSVCTLNSYLVINTAVFTVTIKCE